MGRVARLARLMGALVLSGCILFAAGCGSKEDVAPSHGLVAFSNGWIGVIDPTTQAVSAPFLAGELGAIGDGLFDVVMTPDGKTALVSSFSSRTVHVIDMSNPAAPTLRGDVVLSFFAEDIALTPDGKYALVSDGGFSPKLAVIDVQNRTLVEEYTDAGGNYFCSIAVAADGRTVLAADYIAGKVQVLTLDAAGHLTYVNSIDVSNGGTLYPVNLSISPNGKTAIVAVGASATSPAVPADNMRFPVLAITAPGVVELKSFVTIAQRTTACQTIVFNPAGTKAYASCVRESTDPEYPNQVIVALNVTRSGTASDATTAMSVDFVGTSQLFGVDTMSMDRVGRYLYVANMTLSGAKSQILVVDVKSGSVVKTISFDYVDLNGNGVKDTDEDAYPTGIFIR